MLTDTERDRILSVRCPVCGRGPGMECRDSRVNMRILAHMGRVELSQEQS